MATCKHAACATSCIETRRRDIAYRLDRIRMYADAPPTKEEWVIFLTELDADLRYIAGEFGDMLLKHGDDLEEREDEVKALQRVLDRRAEHGGPLT